MPPESSYMPARTPLSVRTYSMLESTHCLGWWATRSMGPTDRHLLHHIMRPYNRTTISSRDSGHSFRLRPSHTPARSRQHRVARSPALVAVPGTPTLLTYVTRKLPSGTTLVARGPLYLLRVGHAPIRKRESGGAANSYRTAPLGTSPPQVACAPITHLIPLPCTCCVACIRGPLCTLSNRAICTTSASKSCLDAARLFPCLHSGKRSVEYNSTGAFSPPPSAFWFRDGSRVSGLRSSPINRAAWTFGISSRNRDAICFRCALSLPVPRDIFRNKVHYRHSCAQVVCAQLQAYDIANGRDATRYSPRDRRCLSSIPEESLLQ